MSSSNIPANARAAIESWTSRQDSVMRAQSAFETRSGWRRK
jgi:hypothetical protein